MGTGGGARVELGVVGIGNEREQECVDDEKARRKVRVREVKYDRQMVVTTLGRGSVLCPPSKREDDSLVVRTVTRSHTSPCHAHCRCLSVHPTMFSRLPSKLSAPFGILGDEPKLAFRSQPGGIAKLAFSRARNLSSVPFQG